LLAHEPAEGVGDVGLAAAVGANDGHQAMMEGKMDRVCKTLEAAQMQRMQSHLSKVAIRQAEWSMNPTATL